MMFHDMFTTQHIFNMLMEMVVMMFSMMKHVFTCQGTHLSFMLMEMVVMMFPDMFREHNHHLQHVDGDGGDDVP